MNDEKNKQRKDDDGPIHGFPIDEGKKKQNEGNTLSNAIENFEDEANLTSHRSGADNDADMDSKDEKTDWKADSHNDAPDNDEGDLK